ncbi:hypothetical protein ACHQM5_012060 [Ranunculus cassubicifolius]
MGFSEREQIKICFFAFFGFLILVGILSFCFIPEVHIQPVFSIKNFYVPALIMSSNSTWNSTTISFHLKLDNPNYDRGVYYDRLNVTVYYGQEPSFFPVSNVSIPGFYQRFTRLFDETVRKETITATGMPWETARQKVSKGTTIFHLDLKTSVRYEKLFGKTKRYSVEVGGIVAVNNKGSMVKHKNRDLILSSGYVHVSHFAQVVGLACLVFVLLWS